MRSLNAGNPRMLGASITRLLSAGIPRLLGDHGTIGKQTVGRDTVLLVLLFSDRLVLVVLDC